MLTSHVSVGKQRRFLSLSSVDSNDTQTPTETQATEILVDEDEDLWIDLDDSEADEDFVVKSVPKKKKVV